MTEFEQSLIVVLGRIAGALEGLAAANAPKEEGEQAEDIGHVVRRVKGNDDGSETPVIDLYPERAKFRILGVYLNTPQDVAAFEAAAGLRLADLPLYEGDNSIERGKGPKTDKYVVSLSRPARVAIKPNPRYEGPEDKTHPKRLFVRWLPAGAPEPAAPRSPEPAPSQPAASAPSQPVRGQAVPSAPAGAAPHNPESAPPAPPSAASGGSQLRPALAKGEKSEKAIREALDVGAGPRDLAAAVNGSNGPQLFWVACRYWFVAKPAVDAILAARTDAQRATNWAAAILDLAPHIQQ